VFFFTRVKTVERDGEYSRPACTQVENGLLGVVRDNSNFTLLALITSTLKMEAALSLEIPAT
jgi:hypothetical protein